MTEHELKCWPAYFKDLIDGRRTFELRKDDRDYAVGDRLLLQEYVAPLADAKGYYTGHEASFDVVGITKRMDQLSSHFFFKRPEMALDSDYVILSLRRVDA